MEPCKEVTVIMTMKFNKENAITQMEKIRKQMRNMEDDLRSLQLMLGMEETTPSE